MACPFRSSSSWFPPLQTMFRAGGWALARSTTPVCSRLRGAFTVGISQKADTIAYIESQAEHHRKRSFEDEFIAFLEKHKVEYDPRYVWG